MIRHHAEFKGPRLSGARVVPTPVLRTAGKLALLKQLTKTEKEFDDISSLKKIS
jgi:hypothetical protein